MLLVPRDEVLAFRLAQAQAIASAQAATDGVWATHSTHETKTGKVSHIHLRRIK